MTTKKRITLTVSAMCLLLVFGIVSIFAVFSATKNTTNSNVTVTYTANQISGTVSAYHAIESDTSWTAMTVDGTEGAATSINFGENKGVVTATLAPTAAVEVTATKTYAVFKYVFTNDSTANKINLTLNGTPAITNFTVKYVTDSTDRTFADAYTALTATGAADSFTATEIAAKSGDVVGTTYVYVLVELQSDLIDASFTSNFSWVLTKGAAVSA